MKPTETQLARLTLAEREMFNCKKQKEQNDIYFYSAFAIGAFVMIFIEACFKSLERPSAFARILSIALIAVGLISSLMIMFTKMKKAEKLKNRMKEIASREIRGNLSDLEKVDKFLDDINDKLNEDSRKGL